MATKSYWQRLERERISRRRLLGTAGAGAAGLVIVTACGGGNGTSGDKTPGPTSSGVAKNGGRYLTTTDVNVDSLDPHISIAGGPGYFPRVYNVPVKQSTTKNDFIFKDLAEEFEAPEPGGLEWIFTIRPGVKIAPNSFGIPEREMDAEDMRVSFERIKNLPQANACQFVCNFFDSHEASPDGKTYTVRTGKPYAYFLLNIGGTIYTAMIAPREVIEKGDDFMKQNAVGAGPYIVTSYVEGQGITLDRNTNYYRKDDNGIQLPHYDGIDVKIIPDQAARRAAFISQQSYSYGAENIDEANELLGQYDAYEISEPVFTYISFNMNVTKGPWADPKVRKAAMYALNRQQYIDLVYKGDAQANGLVHWPLGDTALPPEELETLQPFDPDRSKQLIKEATGEDSIKVKVVFSTAQIEELPEHLPIFIEQMKNAGFDVQQDPRDLASWLGDYRTKNYDASFSLNQIYETAEIPLDFQHSKGPAGSEIYATGVQDPAIDAIIDATKRVTNFDDRVKAMRSLGAGAIKVAGFVAGKVRLGPLPQGLGAIPAAAHLRFELSSEFKGGEGLGPFSFGGGEARFGAGQVGL